MDMRNVFEVVKMLDKAINELDGTRSGWDVVKWEDPYIGVEMLSLIHLSKKIADKFPNDQFEKMEKRFYSHLYNVDYT
jgi:hypothetical protein